MDTADIAAFRDRVVDRLRAAVTSDGRWEGRLSSSAVATAVAVFALSRIDRRAHAAPVARGLHWLAAHANADGGWGDSPESPSNLTATLLARNAFAAVASGERDGALAAAVAAAEAWLARRAGSLEPDALRAAVILRYGADRTFAGPILAMTAMAGMLGPPAEAWQRVPQLPFELGVLPHALFRWLRLTVVSYALPALIAIGLVRHRRLPSRLPPLRLLRDAVTRRALRIAERMQPPNGGYEEAAPLTAFVAMSLAEAGCRECAVVRRAAGFLLASERDDGSWPIDTNLATWVTTLAINALTERDATEPQRRMRARPDRRAASFPAPPGAPAGTGRCDLPPEQRALLREWLLRQRHTEEHPLTRGAPGGWAWSDLPGAMPDADDTAGALLALRRLGAADHAAADAAAQGVRWLLDLQNGDGGIPTFARGWGRLPFDRSCPDITAHALRAFAEWRDALPSGPRRRAARASARALRYLARAQRADGAWVPLWFGTQHTPGEANLTYGTAQVVTALDALGGPRRRAAAALAERGRAWLLAAQRADGSWGGDRDAPGSIEETALAVRAVAAARRDAAARGIAWLMERTRGGADFPAAPIGLYFARLWYSERLYPVVFAAHALEACLKCA
ncbi:MAG: squalene--hopene cyclase [Lentisphaerae bacterium]|nr:squalene--hopene cyclase [Lentisphaerota bacterium]